MKLKTDVCFAIILFVFLFFLLTIRPGQPWPDDFAMYISEAKNLAGHVPLSATGYIYNPHNPGLGPRLYPPVFPILLVPAYVMGGLNNLWPMKAEIVLFFVALLIVLWRGLGKDLSQPNRAALLGIVGFNPLLWSYKDLILSDILFALLLYLTLGVADRLVSHFDNAPKSPLWIPALAGLAYLCYGTRTIGLILVPMLLLLAVMNWKTEGRSIAVAAGLGLLLCLIQRRFFGGEATYVDQLQLSVPSLTKSLLANVVTYGWSLATFWQNSLSKMFRDLVFILVTALASVAYLRRIRTAPRAYELFLPMYLGVVLLWPNPGGDRYLIPIFPLYIYYALLGVETVRTWMKARRSEPILIPLLAFILFSYAAQFAHTDFGPFKEGINKKEAAELFAYIKSSTLPKDVFIFRRPRALALFTGRNSAVYPGSQNEADFCRYFQSVGADYLIEAPGLDNPSFDKFLARENLAKQLVFSNSDFRVFHVRPYDLGKCANLEASSNAATAP